MHVSPVGCPSQLVADGRPPRWATCESLREYIVLEAIGVIIGFRLARGTHGFSWLAFEQEQGPWRRPVSAVGYQI